MLESGLHTPVVLIVYKRPSLTQQVLASIGKVRPNRLFVIGDGPRIDQQGEAEKVAEVHRLIEQIDWECEILTQYAQDNLGLRRRVASGLDWVFNHVDRAIILEDDCVPDQSFFYYCEELLERYCDDRRIMVISGDNFQSGRKRTPYSYYFSRYNHCWGWATWQRSWSLYDDNLKLWPAIRDGGWLHDVLDGDKRAVKYWSDIFEGVYSGRIDSWAYRWTLACWANAGLTALPSINLVENIGFGLEATHTTRAGSRSKGSAHSLEFPLSHPPFMIRDASADRTTQANHFGTSLKKRFKRSLSKMLPK